MFIALDERGNRVYADEANKKEVYYCQKCGEKVQPKQGNIKKWHFAHMIDEGCDYGKDTDHMSTWHIRMQEYFPKESREYRFIDNKTCEVHIADIYINECNTVLEFQHSRIEEEEFLKRTWFHLNNGRRIVWLFDESKDVDNKEKYRGHLKYLWQKDKNYKWYKWLRKRRRFLEKGPSIKEINENYSIYIYLGDVGDAFQRVLDEEYGYEEILLADNMIRFENDININELFFNEDYFKKYNDIKLKNEWLKNKYDLEIGDRLYFKENRNISSCGLEDCNIENNTLTISIYNNTCYSKEYYSGSLELLNKTIFKSVEGAKSSKKGGGKLTGLNQGVKEKS